MYYPKELYSMDFDELYITYTTAFVFGLDLEKELIKEEKAENYELCEIIKHVIEDHINLIEKK